MIESIIVIITIVIIVIIVTVACKVENMIKIECFINKISLIDILYFFKVKTLSFEIIQRFFHPQKCKVNRNHF